MKFLAYNPVVKFLRTDKSFRVELDVSADQYDAIKDIVKLQDKVLEIEIIEKASESI